MLQKKRIWSGPERCFRLLMENAGPWHYQVVSTSITDSSILCKAPKHEAAIRNLNTRVVPDIPRSSHAMSENHIPKLFNENILPDIGYSHV